MILCSILEAQVGRTSGLIPRSTFCGMPTTLSNITAPSPRTQYNATNSIAPNSESADHNTILSKKKQPLLSYNAYDGSTFVHKPSKQSKTQRGFLSNTTPEYANVREQREQKKKKKRKEKARQGGG